MADRLAQLPVAFLAAGEGTERVELTEPWEAVRAEGGRPVLISTKPGEVTLFNHLDADGSWPVDTTVDQARVTEYAGLVLPGGVANPDQLRMDARAVGFVRSVVDSGRPVAVICHGPWTLVEADVLRGRTLTSYPSLRTDIINAGGTWVDEEVMVDDHGPNVIISSRNPDDLPAFCSTLVEQFSRQAAGTR
ncbi:type 1 glutamine amidotransferase [Natronosporangium hydrolyticum]|uniref:Type 1 glutamine amidotransferase n=1 Tax=Natronosporangium hydrolyticum TaxID=2811111 RepID=A0A895Y6H7_9ACTN|nr:type 1 glutamine amidotransferase domain-containing protein [Natronosporangium hydrolyticum]QSB13357.1 type 1 glutamine amidotransferase [Natronosporangium hydrolyticum]